MLSLITLFAFAGIATASQPGLALRNAVFSGVATFNNYGSQVTTVCGPKTGIPGTWGAAAADISPHVSGGLCYSSVDMDQCESQTPKVGYVGPACPKSNCGLCYQVTNEGGYGGLPTGGIGNSIIVQIIDSCPSVSAWNFCKTEVTLDQRCGSLETNQMDIDEGAYVGLTGTNFSNGVPNLVVNIVPILCP